MTRLSDSGASGVDWSGELEAVHEDGRVVAVMLAEGPQPDECGSYALSRESGDGQPFGWYWEADGTKGDKQFPWRIRNRQPQPADDVHPCPEWQEAPQPADTVTVGRMSPEEADAWVANGPDGPTLTALGALSRLGLIKDDPADPDLEVVAALLRDEGWGMMSQIGVKLRQTTLAAIKRGRALATAEKVLAWGERE